MTLQAIFGFIALLVVGAAVRAPPCDCTTTERWLLGPVCGLIFGGAYWWFARALNESESLEYSELGLRFKREGRILTVGWHQVTSVTASGFGAVQLITPVGPIALAPATTDDWPALMRVIEDAFPSAP